MRCPGRRPFRAGARSAAAVPPLQFPDASRALQDKALDIILVNNPSRRALRPTPRPWPRPAWTAAATSKRTAGRPRPCRPRRGSRPAATWNSRGSGYGTWSPAAAPLLPKWLNPGAAPGFPGSQPKPTLSGRDLANSAMAMARMEAEIAETWTSTTSVRAQEEHRHPGRRIPLRPLCGRRRLKVERVGTLLIEAARGRLYKRGAVRPYQYQRFRGQDGAGAHLRPQGAG